MNHSIYRSWHVPIGRQRSTSVKLNLASLVLAPGIGTAGYLLGGWPGVLAAEALWAGAVLAGTLINWLPHPEGTLNADRQCCRVSGLPAHRVR